MSVRIYIPTRGRVGFNKQPTLREFLAYSSHEPILVCPPEEVSSHRAYYSGVVPCPADGIGPTRQWILENSSADTVVVVSDDLWMYYRPDPANTKLEKCLDLDPLITLIERCVADGYVHGGVATREGNNHKDLSGGRTTGLLDRGHVFVDCKRVNDFHFVSREKVLSLGARFDCLPVMEDFHFTLGLLARGVPNRVIYDHVWKQDASGKGGGCSTYRTAEVQAESARRLAAAFPEWVRVVTKKSKDTSAYWRGLKERTDVIVYWWKAYLWGRHNCPDAPLLTWLQKESGLDV